MRVLSLILGVFCLAGCTGPIPGAGPGFVPIQGTVPMAVHPGETGAITRLPVNTLSVSPADASAVKPDSPQARYDDMVRRGQMKDAKWWNPDTSFAAGVGVVMAAVFGIAFFVKLGSSTGSDLVPTAVLQKLIDQGSECQTITNDDVTNQAPPKRC